MLLPHLTGVVVDRMDAENDVIYLQVRAVARAARCPSCGTLSMRTHGGYQRSLADTPLAGRRVRIVVGVRRCRCVDESCAAATFAEQIPGLTTPWARFAPPAACSLLAIALALAGRARSRLAAKLGLNAGRDKLIRLIRAQPDPAPTAVAVLGVDDFAIRRGHVYATILIDMATNRPIDVLPDRESATLTAWLRDHPDVEIICRDRAGAYAEGARIGAPQAMQVADRFHLWRNLADAVDKTVRAHHGCLRDSDQESPARSGDAGLAVETGPTVPMNGYGHPSRLAARTIERHALIRSLVDQGYSQARIAREHRLDPRTVRRFAEADDIAQLLGRTLRRSSLLDEFKPYLLSRIQEGCTQAGLLHAEIQAHGWRGSVQTVRRFVYPLRTGPLDLVPPPPRPREIIRWIMTDPDHLDADDALKLKDARARCPELEALAGHVSAFAKMRLQLTGHDFPAWCERVQADDLPALHTLVNGFRRDQAAITAGLTLPYNSGAVEGAVTRIKALKRQCYGRAKFDLLRKRILLTR